MKRLYVGNINYNTTEHDLRSVFSDHGLVVDCKVVVDQETRRSKGFAFVEMSNEKEARAALAALDGFTLDGRNIRVGEAKQRTQRRQEHARGRYVFDEN